MIIDVSINLSSRSPIWPGVDPPLFTTTRYSFPGDHEALATRVGLNVHSGTHIDAPLHFSKGASSIDQIDLDVLMGPCKVFEHAGQGHIGASELETMGFSPVRRALFKTPNSERIHSGELGDDYITFLPDAIDMLISTGVDVLGIDAFSIGPFGDLSDSNHITYCGAGGVIIEMIDLTSVEPGDYELVALPVKLKGLEAAPARVLLVREE